MKGLVTRGELQEGERSLSHEEFLKMKTCYVL